MAGDTLSGSLPGVERKRHLIQVVVDGELKRMWDRLSQGEKRALAHFFKEMIRGYAVTKRMLPLDLHAAKEALELCAMEMETFRKRSKELEESLRKASSEVQTLESRLRDTANALDECMRGLEQARQRCSEEVDRVRKEVERWRRAYEDLKATVRTLCPHLDTLPESPARKRIEFLCRAG